MYRLGTPSLLGTQRASVRNRFGLGKESAFQRIHATCLHAVGMGEMPNVPKGNAHNTIRENRQTNTSRDMALTKTCSPTKNLTENKDEIYFWDKKQTLEPKSIHPRQHLHPSTSRRGVSIKCSLDRQTTSTPHIALSNNIENK